MKKIEVNFMLQKVLAILLPIILIIAGFLYFGKNSEEIITDNSIPQTPEEYIRSIDENLIDFIQYDSSYQEIKKVVILTNYGNIKIALYPQKAPMAVENFLTLAQNGYYNGLPFNKIVKDYFIQSGDPDDGTGGRSIWDKPFPNEIDMDLWNFRGAIGMATSEKGENGSQFYIIQAKTLSHDAIQAMRKANFPFKVIEKYKQVGGAPWLDGKHTVFGHIISGIDVVDAIAEASVTTENAQPQPAIIEEITIE
ncbi:MAG: peptidylprolyl isomerase [Oscillospiraceae bacterium]